MPVVYANVIDIIGKRLYTGNIVWLREYIQNAMDSKANEVQIRVEGKDIKIRDNGLGMDLKEIDDHLFSVGGSLKSAEQIGQFGIGMYAGSGICEKILVRTKKSNNPIYQIELDMKQYNDIVSKNPMTLFDDIVTKVFSISRVEGDGEEDHFTEIRFENVDDNTVRLFTSKNGERVKSVVSNSVAVPISEEFTFKSAIEEYLGSLYKIEVSISIDGSPPYKIKRYEGIQREFAEPIIFRDIADTKNGKLLAKLWAAYPADGKTLKEDAGLLVRYKGLTVGDNKVVGSRFSSKDSRRFIGEIVVIEESLQLNTERTWFLSDPTLVKFEESVKELLGEMHGLANFDSKLANGLINKSSKLSDLRERYSEQERIGNKHNAKDLENQVNALELELITNKQKLNKQISTLEASVSGNSITEVKLSLAKRASDALRSESVPNPVTGLASKDKRIPWNPGKYIRTLLENYVIDMNLREKVASKNSKDTLVNLFTLVETSLKTAGEQKPGGHMEIDEILDRFIEANRPPDYIPEEEYKSFYPAFKNFVRSSFTLFRNSSVHTFLDHFDNDRNNLQFLMFGDLLLSLINSWIKK